MQQDKSLTALKTLVISMGIVLVLGFLMVGASVWMKMKSGIPASCALEPVNLKGRGHVVGTGIDGKNLRIILSHPDGALEVVQVDSCSGKELSTLKILTDN